MSFHNRRKAGQQLAQRLKDEHFVHPLILALPRGGVPVAYEVAKSLHAPLDVLIVRKIGVPWNPEFGVGAISEKGFSLIDTQALRELGISDSEITPIIKSEQLELRRRVNLYRNGNSIAPFKGRTVVLVDDGVATGVTARVACNYLKKNGVGRLILAVPVCSIKTATLLCSPNLADAIVCLENPVALHSVGQFYDDFNQTTDKEVIELLKLQRSDLKADTANSRPEPTT